jgi:hypothetical protein
MIGALEEDSPSGGFIKPIQRAQQGSLSRAAGTGDGQDFSAVHLEVRVIDQNLLFDCAPQMFDAKKNRIVGGRAH